MQDQTRLVVYRDSYSLALELERLLARAPRGYAGKRKQLLDAAWSISTNIAEGCGASTNPEFALPRRRHEIGQGGRASCVRMSVAPGATPIPIPISQNPRRSWARRSHGSP